MNASNALDAPAQPQSEEREWQSHCEASRILRMAQVKISRLYVSPGHNFFGHHGQLPGESPIRSVPEIECLAGRGIRGDRFLDYKENYKGQITFFDFEVFDAISRELAVRNKPPSVFRRNVIMGGVDLNALIDVEFEIQSVRFRGMEECKPCPWMDLAFAPGAEHFLKGRGGLRAVILNDGKLRVNTP
jgi:MOSC domain-containing protein YiiM